MDYDPLDPDHDPFGPPAISTLVHCIHCDQEFDSYRIEWRVERDADGIPHGFWCCPMPSCDGRGFGFDIFPVDPEYRDENGERMWCDDIDSELAEDEWTDEVTAEFGDLDFDGSEDGVERWSDDELPFRQSRDRDEDLPL